MPPQADETTLATVFSDIHYYFSPPDYKPLHHRFDKGSYVYVHSNAGTARGRIEIANNVGTTEQDAFTGALETAHITYSYNRPTTVSIALSSPASQATQQPWQLPGYDLRNERKFMYRLNSLDLYLWTPEDAIDLVEGLTKIKSIGALDIQDAPDPDGQAAHGDRSSAVLSPVVQQLEQAALGPPYKRESTDTTQASPAPQPITPSAPAPSSSPGTQAPEDAATAFAPKPYNPAAPAAPETRIHREKTPPPPDAEAGIGFVGAAGQQPQAQSYPYNQQQHPVYGSSSPPNAPQQQQQFSSFAPPPTQGQQPSYSGHMPQQNAPSFAAPPATTAQSPPQPYTHTLPPPQQAYTHTSPPPQQAQHPYSNYNYPSNQQPSQPAYNVHQQFYVPTQAEAGKIPASQLPAHSQIPGQPAQAAPSSSGGKVAKVDRGINKLFKKLEKY